MRYKVLGRPGVDVSELCLGAMICAGTSDIWKAIGALDVKDSVEMVPRVFAAKGEAL
jgi:aryl-alcohol dehydrogenase-like predicted oxidoreductase